MSNLIECTNCDGGGKCPMCAGSGVDYEGDDCVEIKCPCCFGKKDCPECMGSGEIEE